MKKCIPSLLFISLLIPFSGEKTFAQDEADLVTDRPDQTESAEVVPLYTLQIETGVVLEWQDKGEDMYVINSDYGGTLLRFGFHRILEARLGTGFMQTRSKLTGMEPDELHGLAPLELGVKAKILKENGLIPDVAIIASYQVPNTGHEEFSSPKLVQTYIAAFAHTLTDKAGFGYNVGLEHDAAEGKSAFFYSVVIGFSAGEKTGIFLEAYGNKSWIGGAQQTIIPWDSRLDAGMTLLVLPNLQLDLSGGIGLSVNSPKGFISAGFSWRIPR